MNISNENDEMNSDSSFEKPKEETDIIQADKGSVISDLLHVLGFKKSAAKKLPSESLTPTDDTASSNLPAISDSSASLGSVIEADDTENGLPSDNAEDIITENGFANQEACFPGDAAVTRRKPRAKKIIIIGSAVLILFAGAYVLPYLTEPMPPGEDVVASYSGKNVTIEELKSFIALEKAKETEHAACDKHGYDHTKCTPDEKCEAHPIDSIEGYYYFDTASFGYLFTVFWRGFIYIAFFKISIGVLVIKFWNKP